MPPRVLVLHGPNLSLVTDLAALDLKLEKKAQAAGLDLKTFQANSEGSLVDALTAERTRVAGIIVNAARLAPTAEVLAEAIALVKRPTIEVIVDASLKNRSALKGVVLKQISGKGLDGYLSAIELLAVELRDNQTRATGTMNPRAGLVPAGHRPAQTISEDETGPVLRDDVKKTLGKKNAEAAHSGSDGVKKTIGKAQGRTEDTSRLDTSLGALTRDAVRAKISERLSGALTSAGLATWARTQWQQIQRGLPVESGYRDQLEDVLQTLLLSGQTKANDHQLIELMTQLA